MKKPTDFKSWLNYVSQKTGVPTEECAGIITHDHFMSKCYKGKTATVDLEFDSAKDKETIKKITSVAKALNVSTESVIAYILQKAIGTPNGKAKR